jgi:hypothetical protein
VGEVAVSGEEKTHLVLEASNPYDFEERSALDELAGELQEELGDATVRVHHREEYGYGGPLPEILSIWQAAGEYAGDAVAIATIGNWLRRRWCRERDVCGPDERPRPRTATSYDTSGAVRWSIRIDLPDGTVIRVEDQDAAPRPAPPLNPDDPGASPRTERAAYWAHLGAAEHPSARNRGRSP